MSLLTRYIPQYGLRCAGGLQAMSSRLVHKVGECSDPCSRMKFMDVKCKTALVTGGNGGMGLAIADALLSAGLKKAVISGTDCEKGLKAVEYLIKVHGAGTAEFWTLDVTNHKQFEDVFKEMIHRGGSVDILVNNAGLMRDKFWQKEIDIMVKGVYRGMILANEYMGKQKNKGGCVVNVSSTVGLDAVPYLPGYTSTKHAVVGLTKAFGSDVNYKKTGVRHVAVCPGVTQTSLFDDLANNQLSQQWGVKALNSIKKLQAQRASAVGKGTVYLIEYGPPGSLWVVEESKLQRVIPPQAKSYLKKVMEL